jgi:hypothetical protein
MRRFYKKNRVAKVTLQPLGVTGYVYRDDSGFYTRVPDDADGVIYTATTREDALEDLHVALRATYPVVFKKVIEVVYPEPERHRAQGAVAPRLGWGNRWVPDDPETASDVAGPIHLARFEMAERPGGGFLTRPWGSLDAPDIVEWVHGDVAIYPYSDALWSKLTFLRDEVRELDHKVRTALHTNKRMEWGP